MRTAFLDTLQLLIIFEVASFLFFVTLVGGLYTDRGLDIFNYLETTIKDGASLFFIFFLFTHVMPIVPLATGTVFFVLSLVRYRQSRGNYI